MDLDERNIDSSCRTCMKNDVNLINLYEPVKYDEGINLLLVDLLMECTPVQVSKDDGLPQSVCEECMKVVHSSFIFRHQAVKSEKLFKNLLVDGVKVEIKRESEVEPLVKDYFENTFEGDSLPEYDIKHEPDPGFICFTCNKQFTKEKKYLKHMESHTSNIVCPICDKRFQRESSLQKHLSTHQEDKNNYSFNESFNTIIIKNENGEDEERYQCTECEMTFLKLRSLRLHIKKHERDRRKPAAFVCDICHNAYLSKQQIRRHLKTHSDSQHYDCTKCDKSYSRRDQLKAHLNIHKDDKPNICPHCNKAFAQLCSLKDHIRTHTKETPYLCSECGKGFANSSNLRQHMLRHTGVKSHACKMCPKTFCTKGQMTSHMATHTGAQPYKCEKCGAAFTKPNSLKKHSIIHTGDRPFACDSCLMRFTCKDHLTRHRRIHTGEKPYKCQHCARAFTQSNDLVKHTRAHLGQNIYQCSVCGMSFRLKSELKYHYPLHFSDEQAAKDILNSDRNPVVPQMSQEPKEKMPEKFMITINSLDGSNMLAINIEPETNMFKIQ